MSDPSFSTDWSQSISYWPDMFKTLDLIGKPDLRFLEIGCFEGRTTLWLCENVLTDPSSTITVIDTFTGNVEFGPLEIDGDSWNRFQHNLRSQIKTHKVIPVHGRSQEILRGNNRYWTAEYFDFIYIDGSHYAADVLADAVLSWPLLKQGGTMCFDDYLWGRDAPEWQVPQIAVEAFVRCYAQHLKGGPQGNDQYVVIKNKETNDDSG